MLELILEQQPRQEQQQEWEMQWLAPLKVKVPVIGKPAPIPTMNQTHKTLHSSQHQPT
jgi:hypothetical protein